MSDNLTGWKDYPPHVVTISIQKGNTIPKIQNHTGISRRDVYLQVDRTFIQPIATDSRNTRVLDQPKEICGAKINNSEYRDILKDKQNTNRSFSGIQNVQQAHQTIKLNKRLNLSRQNITNVYFFNELTSNVHGSAYKNITELRLSRNNLTKVSASIFSACSNLEILDLSHNKLTNVDHRICQLKNLKVVNLQHNNITSEFIPQCIGNLQAQLVCLDLSHNNLEFLPIEMYNFIDVVLLNDNENMLRVNEVVEPHNIKTATPFGLAKKIEGEFFSNRRSYKVVIEYPEDIYLNSGINTNGNNNNNNNSNNNSNQRTHDGNTNSQSSRLIYLFYGYGPRPLYSSCAQLIYNSISLYKRDIVRYCANDITATSKCSCSLKATSNSENRVREYVGSDKFLLFDRSKSDFRYFWNNLGGDKNSINGGSDGAHEENYQWNQCLSIGNSKFLHLGAKIYNQLVYYHHVNKIKYLTKDRGDLSDKSMNTERTDCSNQLNEHHYFALNNLYSSDKIKQDLSLLAKEKVGRKFGRGDITRKTESSNADGFTVDYCSICGCYCLSDTFYFVFFSSCNSFAPFQFKCCSSRCRLEALDKSRYLF